MEGGRNISGAGVGLQGRVPALPPGKNLAQPGARQAVDRLPRYGASLPAGEEGLRTGGSGARREGCSAAGNAESDGDEPRLSEKPGETLSQPHTSTPADTFGQPCIQGSGEQCHEQQLHPRDAPSSRIISNMHGVRVHSPDKTSQLISELNLPVNTSLKSFMIHVPEFFFFNQFFTSLRRRLACCDGEIALQPLNSEPASRKLQAGKIWLHKSSACQVLFIQTLKQEPCGPVPYRFLVSCSTYCLSLRGGGF